MSCYRPLTISNPALEKTFAFNRPKIVVPCGHCINCLDVKRSSWSVRLYYQWQYCVNNGGFALFETLTYNEDKIPRLYGLWRCFSKYDVQKYLKRIRYYLSKYFPEFDFRSNLKYFLASEFGGLTHRPHYHVVFFVSVPFNQFLFKRIVEKLWSDLHFDVYALGVKVSFNGFGFGFTCPGKLNNGFVCSFGGLNYCSKYVCKDIFDQEYFFNLARRLKSMNVYDKFKSYIEPFHLQSKDFGLSALEFDENNSLDNFLFGDIYLPDSKEIVKSYKLPLYYERKIFYNVFYRYFDVNSCSYVRVSRLSEVPCGVKYSPVYVLNELGLEMKKCRFEKSLKALGHVYDVVLNCPDVPIDYLERINNKFKSDFDSLKSIQVKLSSELSKEDWINYALVYHGCCSQPHMSSFMVNRDVRFDYDLINSMSAGIRPLIMDYENFQDNVDYYQGIKDIDFNYNLIRYIYMLLSLSYEQEKLQKEKDYGLRKTAYLLTKNI